MTIIAEYGDLKTCIMLSNTSVIVQKWMCGMDSVTVTDPFFFAETTINGGIYLDMLEISCCLKPKTLAISFSSMTVHHHISAIWIVMLCPFSRSVDSERSAHTMAP
jgi:hypothetical protein